MKREFLKDLEIADDVIEKIMAEHGKVLASVSTLTGEVETLKAEKASLTSQVTERDTQLETLKGSVKDSEELTKQIADLQNANKTSLDQANAQVAKVKKDYEIKIALEKAGALNSKATLALLDLDTVKIDDSGAVLGLTEQLDKVKEENPYMFKAETPATETPKPTITADSNTNADGQIVDPFEALLQKYK